MKVLVTGFAGHIGSALIRRWPDADLTLLDNWTTQRYASLFDLGIPYRLIEASINDAHAIDEAVKGQDAVVNLAALTDAASSVTDPEAYMRVNTTGAEVVAAACLDHGATLVQLSTTSVYGEQSEAVDETLDPNAYKPASPYAYSKWALEGLLRTKYAEKGLKYTVLRCGTIYGTSPGMRFHTFVNRACWQAAHGLPIPIYRGAWDQKRPYLALDHAINRIRGAASRPVNGVRNVLTGNHTPRTVVEIIRDFLPDTQVIETDAPFLNQTGYEVHSVEPTQSDSAAALRLRSGIEDTLRLLRADLDAHVTPALALATA